MSGLSKTFVVSIVLGLAACGSSTGAGPGAATTPASVATQSATAALASRLGISPALVETALSAAKGALGSGAQNAEQKTAAAHVGVNTAANQAQAAGTPLVAEQKSGLLEGLKNML